MLPTLARLSRSAWKGPFFVAFPNLKEAAESNIPIFTRARSCTILPSFVGAYGLAAYGANKIRITTAFIVHYTFYTVRFHVHNGKHFIPVQIIPEMVGHKLGEFSPTRRRGKHPDPPDRKHPGQRAKTGGGMGKK